MKKIILLIMAFSFAQIISGQELNTSSTNKSDLLKANLISVTIGGSFIVNGTFPALMTERADQFITRIFNEAKSEAFSIVKDQNLLMKFKTEFENYAIRDITLKRVNNEEYKVDLAKFRLTGDFRFNPYLKNDDVLIFPSIEMNTNYVDVVGAVNKEIKFQFVEGDKLSDAILFAGGINQAYDNVNKVEISRLVDKGEREEIIAASIDEDILLKRSDRIRVMFNENDKRAFKVLVLGEVKTPGYIYITRNNSTIREVILKAGSFTEKAWFERSELYRSTTETNILKMKALKDSFEKDKQFNLFLTEKYLNELYLEQLKFARMNDLFLEDSVNAIIDNTLRVLQSKSLIDFAKIFSDTTDDGKYIVKDGDIIVIPQKEDLVYVFGQVNNPGHIKYEPEMKHNYYIQKAGGIGERAKSEVKVIKGNSLSWITASEKINIDPGDFIYVPKDVPKPFEYYLRSVGSISSIVTAIATIILLIVQFGK